MPTETHETYDQQGNLVSSVVVEIPAEVWNRTQILDKARQALTANDTYLTLANPTAAQNAAQAKALTRQVNALIKLLLNDLQDVNGT